MRVLWWVGLVWCLPGIVEAACVEIPAPGVPAWARHGVGYALAAEAGHPVEPTDGIGRQLGQSDSTEACFAGLSAETIESFLTDATMLERFTRDEQQREAARLREQEWQTTLTQIEADLRVRESNWDTLTTEQRFQVMKQLLIRENLRQKLGLP